MINYSLERPFEEWPELQLTNFFESALSQHPINLETCTLIISELKERKIDASEVVKKFDQYGGRVIPWLKGARHRIQHHVSTFEASGKHPRNCKVYLILLTEDRHTPKPWGIYIGQTSKKIEKRLAVHFEEGNKHGSPKVRNRGWQLLYSLCSLIPSMTEEDSCRFEGVLLDSLSGELNLKPLKKLPAKRVKGAGPEQYRIKSQRKEIVLSTTERKDTLQPPKISKNSKKRPFAAHETNHIFISLLEKSSKSLSPQDIDDIWEGVVALNVERWGLEYKDYRIRHAVLYKCSALNYLLSLPVSSWNNYSGELDKDCLRKIEKSNPGLIASFQSVTIEEFEEARPHAEPKKPSSQVLEIRKKSPNAFKRWTADEQRRLIKLFDDQWGIEKIAEDLGRQYGGIRARLIQLELIDPDDIAYMRKRDDFLP